MAIKILFFLSILLLAIQAEPASGQQLPPSAQVTMIICDGLAKPFNADVNVTVEDVKSGMHWSSRYSYSGVPIHLPIAISAGESTGGLYNIYVRAHGYKTSVSKRVNTQGNDTVVYAMLVPVHAQLDLQQAHWQNLQEEDAELLRLILCGNPGSTDCQADYESMLQKHPDKLAALLNITDALQQTVVGGRPVFSYYQSISLEHGLFRDRFFAYVDRSLVLQLKATKSPELHVGGDTVFARLRFFQILHRHATSSFKETELERANLQLSFHENERLTVNGIDCVRVDTDIDYYRRFAHSFKEVIPNLVLHRRSSPIRVFQLRWQATKRKQAVGGDILDFAPLIGLKAKAH